MRQIVTLVAARSATMLTPGHIDRARDAVRGGPPDILSPGEAVDIAAEGAVDEAALRAALDGEAVDLFVMPEAGRRKRALVADMDSTIVIGETLDELADFAGLKQKIAAITARAMNGELDFKAALRERVGMLAGLDLAALEQTWRRMKLMHGARELVGTMRAHGAATALVSGGFTFFTSRVAAACGFDEQRANTLLDDGRALTGKVAEPILDKDSKLAELHDLARRHGLALADTLAIGDGANDLPMILAAGLGIAFQAKPTVAAEARFLIVHGDLRAALFVQGYRAGQFVV